ncbi:MAG: DUF2867 domain-containing protein [Pseudomonadota bacterium]
MPAASRPTASFPTARIASRSGGLPVEVTLISQLGPGAGDRLCLEAEVRQRGHGSFADALDEPAATLAATDIGNGETTALHSFAVGPQGHPFHRHAGHRVFTAVSGSGGAQLRFSSASDASLRKEPGAFVTALNYVDIPPDCLFTVRFGGGTWHQFAPLLPAASHPTLFALSCHTNELGGIEDSGLLAQVGEGGANIHDLTELLPQTVRDHLLAHPLNHVDIPTLALSLNERPGSLLGALCGLVRRVAGRVRSLTAACRCRVAGFVGRRGRGVVELPNAVEGSLLEKHLSERFEHEDTFLLVLHGGGANGNLAASLLADVLDGFLSNRPIGVSWLMKLRNVLVTPFQLRTSPLGCPASSLLSADRSRLFAGKYPVLEQSVDPRGRSAEVLLGADDRHLRFRSCVGVRFVGDDAHITLGTRVQFRNWFGRIYMAGIDRVHRAYVSPAMLSMAVEHAQRRMRAVEESTVLAF